MKAILAYLAAACTVLASEKAFNIHDDLDAFPQYKIVFDPSSISPDEAQSLLSNNVSDTTPAIDGSSLPIPSEHIRIVMPPTTQSLAIPPYNLPVPSSPQPYLCSIPRPSQSPLNDAQVEAARIASLNESDRANRRGWELLEGMKGQCIFHVKGWWAYEYCYGTPDSMVKQFHPVLDETGRPKWPLLVDSEQAYFILGRAQPTGEVRAKAKGGDRKDQYGYTKKSEKQKTLGDETKPGEAMHDDSVKLGEVEVAGKTTGQVADATSPIPPGGTLVNKGETTYLTHHLTSGTKCDLTYRYREIEIQYHCRPELTQDWIAVVKEITTCSYLMVVQTPRLCKDPAFQKKAVSDSLEIKCRKISEHTRDELAEEEVAAAAAAAAAASAAQAEVANVLKNEKKPTGPAMQYKDGKIVIGGTVIGAGNYFPIKDGQKANLKQPANWQSSGTKDKPDGELVGGPEPEKPSGKFRLDKPTVGGEFVGVASPRIIEMASVKRDHADVVYTVVASGIIGDPNWEVLDEKILKAFKLGPDEIGLILQDVDWKMDGKGMDGQRWYLVVLTGPKVQKGLEIRAVVETEVSVKGKEKKEKGRETETVTKQVVEATGKAETSDGAKEDENEQDQERKLEEVLENEQQEEEVIETEEVEGGSEEEMKHTEAKDEL